MINSFKNWCIDNDRMDLLERWDYDLNELNPDEIACKSNKKFWFKCPKGIHQSELKNIQYFSSGKQVNMHCEACESFAQYIIDVHGEDYLEKIWSTKNENSAWLYRKKSNKKIWLNCLDNKNHIYDTTCCNYVNGCKCPYCEHKRRCHDQSLGYLHPEIFEIWSQKNKLTPYDYTEKSSEKVWFKCKNDKHEDFKRSIGQMILNDLYCPICSREEAHLKSRKDLTGRIFGMLTVVEPDVERSNSSKRTYWKCRCSCGNNELKSVETTSLLSGKIKSCGCLKHRRGKDSPSWKGGLTPVLQKERNSKEYKQWCALVYKKDNYTCQCCGEYKNINKEAHHILNFSSNPNLRYDVSNGITLCRNCHFSTVKNSFHNLYGTTKNTPEQLEEFINNKRKELGIKKSFCLDSYLNGDILKRKA